MACFKIICLVLLEAALGSIPELPAETCKEIKMSEGEAVSRNYWFSSIKPGMTVLAFCDMETEGKYCNQLIAR